MSLSATQIVVEVGRNDEYSVSSDGSDPTTVTVDRGVASPEAGDKEVKVSGGIRRRSTEPTEIEIVVSLDGSYRQILENSWVVLERPSAADTSTQTIITRVSGVREASRADYGITARGTQITLPQPWLNLEQDTFAVIRHAVVHAQSELLELADAPLEEANGRGEVQEQDDNSEEVTLEPICGEQIELDALYDGLEPGRWLIVSGERENLPGVTASELVMLAGVTQGVQQVQVPSQQANIITGRGNTGPGGYDVQVSARLLPDGSATGHASIAGGATGRVERVVPPSGANDFWCLNVKRTDTGPGSGDQRINLYVRDIGDGKEAFDEINFSTGVGIDCTSNPAPGSAWIALTEGDFKALTDLPGDRPHSFLQLAEPLAYCYKRETVKIYGNVGLATHGETRTEVLGSGDGSKALQKFTMKQSPLTHVAATTPTGTESTLQVSVDDIRWHEAASLAEMAPTDRGFVTQRNERDEVAVVFGDGEHGARLPTGVENVRAVYRTGIGKAGNVAAEQISQLATRPLGLKGVTNPQPATGGADRDSDDQARSNVPMAVMALGRLVSVRDYEDFARAFAGFAKASAVHFSDGRRQLVHLTIAGIDDIPISEASELYRNLVQALHRFGDPQQPLSVEVRELIMLIISAGVRVLADYQWESVEGRVRAALLDTFGFERRELGQDALLSEVISTIQGVPGVAYVDVDTFGGIPEKKEETPASHAEAAAADTSTRDDRRALLPSEIAGEIKALVERADQPHQRVPVELAGRDGKSIRPAQLAFLTPRVAETLILKEITE
jgi:hypothetical protein